MVNIKDYPKGNGFCIFEGVVFQDSQMGDYKNVLKDHLEKCKQGRNFSVLKSICLTITSSLAALIGHMNKIPTLRNVSVVASGFSVVYGVVSNYLFEKEQNKIFRDFFDNKENIVYPNYRRANKRWLEFKITSLPILIKKLKKNALVYVKWGLAIHERASPIMTKKFIHDLVINQESFPFELFDWINDEQRLIDFLDEHVILSSEDKKQLETKLNTEELTPELFKLHKYLEEGKIDFKKYGFSPTRFMSRIGMNPSQIRPKRINPKLKRPKGMKPKAFEKVKRREKEAEKMNFQHKIFQDDLCEQFKIFFNETNRR